jgi:hypothetical protein
MLVMPLRLGHIFERLDLEEVRLSLGGEGLVGKLVSGIVVVHI